MASLTVNHVQNLPLRLVEGSDDDLVLSFNTDGFEAYVTKMMRDERFLVTADLVGQPIPTSAAGAAALLATLEAKGGDFVDMFKGPVVYRVLKDEGIDWAAEGAGGRRLYELVGKFLNGYDGLAVRRARARVDRAGGVVGGRRGEEAAAARASLPSSLGRAQSVSPQPVSAAPPNKC